MLKVTFVNKTLLLLCIVTFTGCIRANYQKPVHRNQELSRDNGYIYGLFKLHARLGGARFSAALLDENSGDVRRIMFNAVHPVMAIAVPPGQYRITGVMLAERSRFPMSREEIPFQGEIFSTPFQVSAGQAVYVGDFHGEVRSGGMSWEGSFRAWGYNIESTTAELHRRFPNLTSFPKASAWPENEIHQFLSQSAGS